MKKNFSNINNLFSYLTDPDHYKVKRKSGIINLCSVMTLQNGMKIELSVGELLLSEVKNGCSQELSSIIPIVYN